MKPQTDPREGLVTQGKPRGHHIRAFAEIELLIEESRDAMPNSIRKFLSFKLVPNKKG